MYTFFMAKNLTTEEFILKAREIHGWKYDYSKVKYINAKTKICIICPVHGEFWQTPHNHLSCKTECPKCSKTHIRYNTESFIKKAIEVHGDKYDYSKVEYKNCTTKIKIICKKHGVFEQSPKKHINGRGCPLCGKKRRIEKLKKSKEIFIQEANKKHCGVYDYSLVDYKNAFTKVKIICKKHGIFEQTPHHHLNYHGCPKCNASILEKEIMCFLTENKINFIYQYRASWLGGQSLDFYLPNYGVGIECQGEQHFEKVYYRSKLWNEEKAIKNLKEIIERDNIKLKKCEKNNVHLLYFANEKYNSGENIFCDKNLLLNEILKFKNL